MTFQTYLRIDGIALPVQKDDYSVDYRDVVADSGGVTEAGTTIRDVIREGVPSISVTIPVSLTWLKKLRKMKKVRSPLNTIQEAAGCGRFPSHWRT